MTIINGTPAASPQPVTATTDTVLVRPQRSRRMQPMLTLADAVDHLLRNDEVNPGEARSVERAVAACESALSSFVSHSQQGFRYYQSRDKLIMPGSLSLGTVTVAGGQVTTGEALPSWAALGHLRVNQQTYPVLSSVAGASEFWVGDALQDGEYEQAMLEQIFFPLPQNFRRRGSLADRRNVYPVMDMHGGTLQGLEDYYRWVSLSGIGRSYSAVTIDNRFQGALMLAIWPPYADRTELSLFYERYPEPLEVHREGGTGLSVTGVNATVGTAIFNSKHVGSALHVATNNSEEFAKSLSSRSLRLAQRIIVQVVSDTDVVLDEALDADVADRAFFVSDIVDVQPGPQREAYLRLCEYELLRQSKSRTADRKFKEFISQMHVAMADDSRYRGAIDGPGTLIGGIQIGDVDGRPE